MTNQLPNHDQILNLLRTDQATITFTKADGSERKMVCTLVESKIPADKRPKSKEGEESSSIVGSAVRVFDLEKGEWRSFRFDSVISFGV